ncbi:hypothetical protein L198_02241 [Cryptococcus wingfieldii CBS 7118]|uniref:WSC domain-containing protein n=1 Tax=Cryptococcus wingfieldii CBS 7118 TaxID=1295528 RepID=A0A1E3JRA4_9TREE|nr:hypothetical protein L198_02241 [Cryptococcus wingfieldii CBS 7118]ODO03394.1 hypothetical protein L198_02241 [Cryptococcus wingfieldii CBS 7118]
MLFQSITSIALLAIGVQASAAFAKTTPKKEKPVTSSPINSEFIGCLDGGFKPVGGKSIKDMEARKSYYECSNVCQSNGNYPYAYFTNMGKGVQTCVCSSMGPTPSDYVTQSLGSFGCKLGQTRAAITKTDHHFIVCSSGFIGEFENAGTYYSPSDCLEVCEGQGGALVMPVSNGFRCRCGNVSSVKSVSACGDPGVEFSYVYKPKNKKPKGKVATSAQGKKKLGKGKKVYDNPCDDPDSILGYCGFGDDDTPVFHKHGSL